MISGRFPTGRCFVSLGSWCVRTATRIDLEPHSHGPPASRVDDPVRRVGHNIPHVGQTDHDLFVDLSLSFSSSPVVVRGRAGSVQCASDPGARVLK